MRDLIWAALVLVFSWASYHHGLQQGWYDGNRYADRVCEERIAQRVEDGIAGARRVMGIRERAAYERGKRSCEN